MKIEPIENNEQGLSVRQKLNRVLAAFDFECFLTGFTEDDTQTELLIPDESEQRMIIPIDTAWAFDILLESFTGGGAGAGAVFAGAWRMTGAIINNDGTVELAKNWDATNPSYSSSGRFNPALVSGFAGTTTVLAGDVSNTFGAPSVEADDTNKALVIKVTATNYSGGAAKEFHWAARVRIVEIQFTPS